MQAAAHTANPRALRHYRFFGLLSTAISPQSTTRHWAKTSFFFHINLVVSGESR